MKLNTDVVINVFAIILFFLIESFYPSEYLLLILLITLSFVILKLNKFREAKLYILGLILGFIVEYLMGFISRSQYWINTSLLPIPLWLPFAWGYGFIIVYKIGKLIVR